MATEQMTTQLQTIVLEPAPAHNGSGSGSGSSGNGNGSGNGANVPASPSFVTQSGSGSTRSRSRDNSTTSLASSAFGHAQARPGAVARMDPGQPQWQHRVSASFSALADQIAAAGKAIALMPQANPSTSMQMSMTPASGPSDNTALVDGSAMYHEQIQELQETQQRLEEGLDELRAKVQELEAGPEALKKQLEDLQASVKLE